MYILLIFYFLFLLVYIGVNAYIIFRVHSMRVRGDLTHLGIAVYITAIALVILVCFLIMANLDWQVNLWGGKFGL